MANPVVLVTGANGEIGRSLLERLHATGRYSVVTVDLTPLPEKFRSLCVETYAGNIMDRYLLDQIAAHHEIEVVFHLAALLSTRGERDPELAHQVNVEGTLHLLRVAQNQSQRTCTGCPSSDSALMTGTGAVAICVRRAGDDVRYAIASQ